METTPTLRSHCAGGDDGGDVYQLTDNAMEETSIDGKAAFRTNIPGIYYTLAFFPDGNGVTAWFPQTRTHFIEQVSSGMTMGFLMRKTGTFVWKFGRQMGSQVYPQMKIS
jgi:hypothetical protein